MFLSVISEILGQFVETVNADNKHFPLIGTIYRNQFKCNYLRNK